MARAAISQNTRKEWTTRRAGGGGERQRQRAADGIHRDLRHSDQLGRPPGSALAPSPYSSVPQCVMRREQQ